MIKESTMERPDTPALCPRSSRMQRIATLLGESPGAVLKGRVDSSYRNGLILTFGGGTNEVQRDIIAMAGMGLPHYKE